MSSAVPNPSPRTFYVASSVELLERLGLSSTFIGLSLYLSNIVGFDDVECGPVLGALRFLKALATLPGGATADRITFCGARILSLSLYAAGFAFLFAIVAKWAPWLRSYWSAWGAV